MYLGSDSSVSFTFTEDSGIISKLELYERRWKPFISISLAVQHINASITRAITWIEAVNENIWQLEIQKLSLIIIELL